MLTSPAGFFKSQDDQPETKLVLRPMVKKTFIKGVIALSIFSLFLDFYQYPLNFLIFVALSLALLGAFMFGKRSSTYTLGEQEIVLKRILGKPHTIYYKDIQDLSISQGMLARRFNCGSVYMILKHDRGRVTIMGGGTAERLEDIPDPAHVYELISSRLNPFGS